MSDVYDLEIDSTLLDFIACRYDPNRLAQLEENVSDQV